MEVFTDELAARGYVALAPALYSRTGTLTTDARGAPTPEARALQDRTPDGQVAADLSAAITYLRGLDSVGDRKIGAVGFCAGGRWGLFFAAEDARLNALVAFYPTVIDETPQSNRPVLVWDVVARVGCPVCVLFGDQDRPTVEKYRDRLRGLLAEHGKEYEFHLYSGASHDFTKEDGPPADQAATRSSWAVSHVFLERWLGKTNG
jgi:carboxymethylenebutenolidase